MRNYGSPHCFLRDRTLPRKTRNGLSCVRSFFFTIETAHRAFAERLTDLCELAFQVRKQPSSRVLRPVRIGIAGAGVVVLHDENVTDASNGIHTQVVGVFE